MAILIEGLGLSGYRSFGNEAIQRLGPFGTLNLLIGNNNCGKSNILRFLYDHFPSLIESAKGGQPPTKPVKDDERPRGQQYKMLKFEFGFSLDGLHVTHKKDRYPQAAEKIIDSEVVFDKTRKLVYVPYVQLPNEAAQLPKSLIEDFNAANIWTPDQWSNLAAEISKSRGSLEDNIRVVIKQYLPAYFTVPKVEMIEAIRQVGTPGSKHAGYSGQGIIDLLAQHEKPEEHEQEKKEKFNKINEFLRNVLSDSDIELNIPYSRTTILVTKDNRVLALESLGTGIHELVIIAIAATLLEGYVLCIEEPEIHLHPLLQKKLIKYLLSQTQNQYFIATHSPHLIDIKDACVFHVRLNNEKHSIVEDAVTDRQKWVVCDELGLRASDLLQSNCVLWVEGPSDRLHLRHWITAFDPSLEERIHYSIMFYGGRLQSHVSGQTSEDIDGSTDDFISLVRINRNSMMLMDSDKRKKSTPLNETKERLITEFSSGPGFAWITSGRTIENYWDHKIVYAAIKAVHPGENVPQIAATKYARAFVKRIDGKRYVSATKIKVAEYLINTYEADLTRLDLKDQIEKTVKFIKQANDL